MRTDSKPKVYLPLYPRQAEFLDSEALFRGFVGGRGAGKSWIAAYDLLKRAKPGRTYMLVAPSYKAMKRSDLRTFLQLSRQLGMLRHFHKGDMVAELTNGAEVICASADDPETLRGPNLSGVALSEASLMHPEAYFICIASLREGGEFGWLTAAFTPKGKSHWTFQVFGTGRPDTDLIVAGTWENPFLAEEVFEKLCLQYGATPQQIERIQSGKVDASELPLRARQELGGAFVAMEGTEWPPDYFPDSIWFDDWPVDLDVKVLSLDPSKGKEAKSGDYAAHVFLGRSRADHKLYVDAWLRKDLTTSELAAYGLDLYQQFNVEGYGIETDQFQSLLKNEIERRAAEKGIAGIRTYPVPTGGVPKPVRIRRLTSGLSRGEFRFKANSPGAALLVQQLMEFPVGVHDDGPDALEMALRLAIAIHNGRVEDGGDEPLVISV